MDLEEVLEAAQDGIAIGDLRFPRPFNSLRLYNICRGFDFQVMPEGGGLLDQDPQLIDDWQLIRSVDNEAQTERSKKK
jgi:hypothetical protein